jgi:hypothetical protein
VDSIIYKVDGQHGSRDTGTPSPKLSFPDQVSDSSQSI